MPQKDVVHVHCVEIQLTTMYMYSLQQEIWGMQQRHVEWQSQHEWTLKERPTAGKKHGRVKCTIHVSPAVRLALANTTLLLHAPKVLIFSFNDRGPTGSIESSNYYYFSTWSLTTHLTYICNISFVLTAEAEIILTSWTYLVMNIYPRYFSLWHYNALRDCIRPNFKEQPWANTWKSAAANIGSDP